jgi:hypothetical protein
VGQGQAVWESNTLDEKSAIMEIENEEENMF